MLRRNEESKLRHSVATLICDEKKKSMFKDTELKHFEYSINLLKEEKRYEAKMVLEYIMHGQKIVLKSNKEILLFPSIDGGRVEPAWIISDNKELYKILKELIYS